MKKATPLLLLAAVWSAALVSAVALAYALQRPVAPAASLAEVFGVPEPPRLAATSTPQREATNTIRLSPVVIVGHVAVPALLPLRPRDLSEMRCSTWQDLTQGPVGQLVRYCE
jgi:hypothetical protein